SLITLVLERPEELDRAFERIKPVIDGLVVLEELAGGADHRGQRGADRNAVELGILDELFVDFAMELWRDDRHDSIRGSVIEAQQEVRILVHGLRNTLASYKEQIRFLRQHDYTPPG